MPYELLSQKGVVIMGVSPLSLLSQRTALDSSSLEPYTPCDWAVLSSPLVVGSSWEKPQWTGYVTIPLWHRCVINRMLDLSVARWSNPKSIFQLLFDSGGKFWLDPSWIALLWWGSFDGRRGPSLRPHANPNTAVDLSPLARLQRPMDSFNVH